MVGLLNPAMFLPRRRQQPVATPVVFSERDLNRLSGADPRLRDLLIETERRASGQGIDLGVSEVMRSPERQAEMVASGLSQTYNSRHLNGTAADINIQNPDGSVNWDFEAYRPVADIAKRVAAEQGIPDFVWGGDWQSLRDGVHFQVGGRPSGNTSQQIGADTMAALGRPQGGLLSTSVSAMNAPPQEPARRSFWDNIPGLSDPDRRARLAIGLEGLTLNPNEGWMQSMQGGIDTRREDARMNETAQWLRSQPGGEQFAAYYEATGDTQGAFNAYLQSQQPQAAPQPIEINGQLVDPLTGAVVGDYRTAEVADPGYVMLTPAEIAATPGLDPARAYQRSPDNQITAVGGAPAVVNNINGGENAFSAETGKLLAQEANAVVQQGSVAQRSLGQLITLNDALADAPQGAEGAIAALAGKLGIKSEGSSNLELATSILAQLVPAQRPPGSGTMSDADLALFRQSLPQLINTPEGNAKILQTMQAIAQYDVARMAIARNMQLGDIDAREANDQYNALGNPLADFVTAPAAPSTAAPNEMTYNPATREFQ